MKSVRLSPKSSMDQASSRKTKLNNITINEP